MKTTWLIVLVLVLAIVALFFARIETFNLWRVLLMGAAFGALAAWRLEAWRADNLQAELDAREAKREYVTLTATEQVGAPVITDAVSAAYPDAELMRHQRLVGDAAKRVKQAALYQALKHVRVESEHTALGGTHVTAEITVARNHWGAGE